VISRPDIPEVGWPGIGAPPAPISQCQTGQQAGSRVIPPDLPQSVCKFEDIRGNPPLVSRNLFTKPAILEVMGEWTSDLIPSSLAAFKSPKNLPSTSKAGECVILTVVLAESEGRDPRELRAFDLSNSIDEFGRSGS